MELHQSANQIIIITTKIIIIITIIFITIITIIIVILFIIDISHVSPVCQRLTEGVSMLLTASG